MKIYRYAPLKPFNTFGIAAKARRLVVIDDEDDLLISPLLGNNPWFILGAGSDVVFTRDFDGFVLTMAPDLRAAVDEGCRVTAWAGTRLDDLVRWTLDRGLYGLENLSAIPGTVGAAAVQNVGAYGAEAKDTIVEVRTVDLRTCEQRTYTADECRFGYRTSRFKGQGAGRELIVSVTFALHSEFVPNLTYKALETLPHATAQELRSSIAALRWQKLPRPEEHGSAGSFFKNPVVDEATCARLKAAHPDMPEAHRAEGGYKLSAGWLIDKAGWKGRSMGRAGVWPQNALVLYNLGGCTGAEVVALAEAIQADVRQKFGIDLAMEAIII